MASAIAGSPPTYDYRNSLRPWDIVTQVTCVAVSTLVVMMRSYTKFFLTRSASWEDYTCLTAWAGLVGYAVIAFEADKVGSGIHQPEVAFDDLVRYAQLANASQIMYGPLIFITKLSILLLYLRVFAPNSKSWTFIFIHLLLWFNAAFYLADTLVEIFSCVPREKIWNPDTPGRCVNINVLILTTAVLNTISDVSLLLLPIFCVWRLQMRTSQKVGISGIFAAGSFGCVASIMRLVISVQKNHTTDPTYDWFPEFLWTSAEISAGLVASCLPAVPSFLRHVGGRAVTIINSGKGRGTKSSSRYGKSSSRTRSWPKNHDSSRSDNGDDELLHGGFMELDDVHAWRKTHDAQTVTTQVNAGSIASTTSETKEESSIPGGGVRQTGILKTVHVDIQETQLRDPASGAFSPFGSTVNPMLPSILAE